MATANFIIRLLHVELVAYKTEDICQLMIDGFPKKYQVRYKLTVTLIFVLFVFVVTLDKGNYSEKKFNAVLLRIGGKCPLYCFLGDSGFT